MRYRAEITTWIEGLEIKLGLSRAELIARTGMPASTIYRWFKPELNHIPSHASVLRIANALGVDPPGSTRVSGQDRSGVTMTGQEAEAEQSWWIVNGRSLELLGYLPGDSILLDETLSARPGDVVIAQLYDPQGGARTEARMFDTPFLVTRAVRDEDGDKPRFADGQTARIVGVVTRLVRERKA